MTSGWFPMTADLTHIRTAQEEKLRVSKKIKIKVRAKLRDTNISSVTDAWISCYEENIKNSTLRFMVLISGWYNEKYSSIDWSYYLLSPTVYLMHSEIFNPRFGICQNLCPRKLFVKFLTRKKKILSKKSHFWKNWIFEIVYGTNT